MGANEAINKAEANLKELTKGVNKLMKQHKSNFKEELNGIISLLDELQPVVTELKIKIKNFKFHLSINEVEDFQKTLECHKTVCENLSSQPKSPQNTYLSDQLHKLEKSLQGQLDILQGQKPHPPERTGVLGVLTNTALHYTNSTPEETGAKVMLKGWLRRGIQTVINTNRPEHPKPSAKELFETLRGRVETLMKTRDRFYNKLACVKSRLHELEQVQVQYIEVIEDKTVGLHFWIKEVEDLKKELSEGIKVCDVDFSKASNWNKISDDLHLLDKSLQGQVHVLKNKIIKHEHRYY